MEAPPGEQDVWPHLRPGEHLRWSGAPRPDAEGISGVSPLLLVLLGDLAVIVVLLVTGAPAWLVGIGLLLGGLASALVVQRLSVARHRAGVVYAVTDSRLLVVQPTPPQVLLEVPLREVGHVELHEHADGTSTVAFGDVSGLAASLGAAVGPDAAAAARPAFRSIDGGPEVLALIERLRDDG